MVKNLPANVGDVRDTGLIPGLERSLGGGNGNPLQYSAWRMPWTREPGRGAPWGHEELDVNEAT